MFVSQYVFGARPLLDYMQTFYPGGLQDLHLTESVQAVSLALFSNEFFSSSIIQAARKKYGYALSLTNKALRSARTATNDTMLLTVLLLDLFEGLSKKDHNSSLESETKHIDGAIALVRLRGDEQFHDPIGLRMFVQLSLNVLIRCLQWEVEVSADLISLRIYAAQFVDARDTKWSCSNVMIQYAELRNAMRIGKWSDGEIIRFATVLDTELINICTNMPSDWQFSTIPTPVQLANAFGDFIHVYSSPDICKTWNTIRIVRILLHEVIQEYCRRLLTKTSLSPTLGTHHQIKDCATTILSLLSDICASVLQYTECSQDFRSQVPKNSRNSSQNHPNQNRAGAHGLIFPLYIAASSSVCPNDMREWIIGRLGHIGSVAVIPLAIVVKEMVERGERGNPWVIAAMSRCLSF